MMERLLFLKSSKLEKFKKSQNMINSSSEMHGVCRHNTKFHRFKSNYNFAATNEGLTSPKKSDRIEMKDLLVSNCSKQEQSIINNMPVPLLCQAVDNSNGYLEVNL